MQRLAMARWFSGLARPVSQLMSRPTRHESTHESTSAVLGQENPETQSLDFATEVDS